MNGENFKTGIENRTVDSIASFFRRIWKDSHDQMCHARMIFDKDNTPVDYILLDINPAFEKALGLSKEQVRGQMFTGLFPHHDPGWIRKCGDVVRTGRMLASVEHNPGPDLWYEVQVFALDCANEFITLYNNITDYKRAEMAFAESEKKYRELVRLAPTGIFEIDFRSRRFTLVNDAICRSTGYDRTELLDMSPFDLLNGSAQGLFQTRIEQWLNGEEPVRSGDYLIRTKDGRELWANLDVSFAADKNGRLVGATVVSHDITERKRAEEFLLNSSLQLEELIYERTRKIEEAKQRVNNNDLEGIADAFYDLDYEYKFTYVSLNIEPLWNCKIEDLLGRDIREVFPNIVGTPMYAQYQSVMENKEPAHFTTKSAYTEIWMEVDVYSIQNGISVYFRDITNRKRIEVELEQARQQTTDILESILDAFYALDHACRFTYVNTAAEKLLGKTKEELIGSGVSEAFPTTSLVFLNNLRDVIQNNEPFHTEIFAIPIQKWIEVNIYPYNNGVSVYFRDITERKLMEATLRESEALYRTLFENSEDSFVLVEPIFDELGDSDGYRMLQGNLAWERQTGLKATDFIGKRINEAMPDVEPVSLATYAEIALTGLTKHFECYNTESGRWYDQHAFLYREGQVGVLFRDITARKQAEEEKQVLLNAIQIERDKLSALIHNMPDEVWFTDAGGDILITNKSTREEFGASYYGINAAEIAASLETYRADGSPRPLAETPLLRAVKGEEIRNLVEIIRTPANNELRYRQVNAAPVHDIDGNIIGAATITRDITEQKQAEKDYAMSRLHKISTLYVNNGDLSAILNEILELAISFTGADMGTIQFLEAESGVLRIMAQRGFEQPLLDFFAIVDHGIGTCGTALHRGERVIVEDVTQSPLFADTTVLDVVLEAGVRAAQSTPLISRSGVLVGMLSTHFRSSHTTEEQDLQLVDLLAQQAADLIERKKSEEALRRSEEHFSMIFNNSPDMICIIDMETDQLVDINLRFTEALGYIREEVIGRTLQELNYPTDSLQDEQKHKSGNLKSNETVLRTKSGRLINVLLSSEVVEIGHRKQRITIFKDITKEKMVEAEMARLDRLNLVGEMAAGIGHEVRNPMTTVKGFLQLLGEKNRYAKDKYYFELMIEELDRANSIITEFLSLARNKSIDLKMNNLNKIIKLILPLIQADGLVTDKYIKLETKEIPDLMLDEKEIRQLVLNLVRNGLQAMEPGKTLTLETLMEEDNVVLLVKDQGSGIPDEIVDKIGTPFFTTKDTGTGLGLAVCYSIAARHNARMDYLTGVEGTTFYVRFSSTAG